MKKFISMVMAAAMVVSLVPATAFAASADATFKVVSKQEVTATEAETIAVSGITDSIELQIKMTDVNGSLLATDEEYDVTLKLTNAEFIASQAASLGWAQGQVLHGDNGSPIGTVTLAEDINVGDDTVKLTVTETANFQDGDVVYINLPANTLALTKTKVGTVAAVKVTGDFGASEALPFVQVVNEGITAELDDECKDVAPEEVVAIDPIVIEPNVDGAFNAVVTGATNLNLKLNKGFEFANTSVTVEYFDPNTGLLNNRWTWTADIDGDEIDLADVFSTSSAWVSGNFGKLVVSGLEVEATTADAGDVANVKVKLGRLDTVTVAEVAKVIDYKVVMSLVDADEDVPVFYNGVDSQNNGLTVDDDHEALAVNIAETFEGAWSNHKEFTLSLPAGVHVVDIVDIAGEMDGVVTELGMNDVETLLWNAYQKGDHEEFVFAKRQFDETRPEVSVGAQDLNEMEFTLVLVADPDFVGDVVLKLEGAALDTQEVTIAKFVAPYTIKAEQNDVIIDYRYTEVPTEIVITEAEAGLWAEDLEVRFAVERAQWIDFEDDATVTVNEESDMEIDDDVVDGLGFIVDEESDEEPAVVTISGIELFMQRSIPAGPYDLDVVFATTTDWYEWEALYAPDCDATCTCARATGSYECATSGHECYVADVADYSTTAKEAWINVVTAGRDQDDASFTTKVVVPVGETTMYAGEKAITLDVPAYINANGYTMLPVRAVATALGINNEAVQWDQATKTVIIMYGQRIITMTAGQSVVYVSGTAIPAKAAVEIVDGRAFLGLRDLATTLGISAVSYDDATKTATLN